MSNTFVQKKFPFRTRSFEFISEDVLKVKRNSPMGACEWMVDLSQVNPEEKLVKTSVLFWYCLMVGAVVGMFVILLTQLLSQKIPGITTNALDHFWFFFRAFVMALPGYWLSKSYYSLFHYDLEGEPLAFGLYYDQPNESTVSDFITELQQRIKVARMHNKARDIQRAKEAIAFLTKERVLNETVSTILQYRVDDIEYFSND